MANTPNAIRVARSRKKKDDMFWAQVQEILEDAIQVYMKDGKVRVDVDLDGPVADAVRALAEKQGITTDRLIQKYVQRTTEFEVKIVGRP